MLLIELLKLFTSFNFFLIFVLNQYFFQMVQKGIVFVFFPFRWYKNQTNFPRYEPFPVWQKFITSGRLDKAALGLLVAAAVVIIEVISKALSGFLIH